MNASCEFDVETLAANLPAAHRHPRQVQRLCHLPAARPAEDSIIEEATSLVNENDAQL